MSNKTECAPRILKIAECPSLSGRTSITYHVGVRDKDDICFRIWGSTGKGVFSKEWVCASAIHKVLGTATSISAPTLLPVFEVGRSVNTSGFLLAVLKQEGLVALSEDQPHKYVRVQSESFVAEMAALIKAGTSLDPSESTAATSSTTRRPRRAGAAPWPQAQQTESPPAK